MKNATNKLVLSIVLIIFFISCFSFQKIQNISAVSFPDVPQTHWAYEAIMFLVDKGILSGYPDGTFRPNNPVQRAETAIILGKIFNLQPIDTNKSSFYDVPKTHWAISYIEAIYRTKLMYESTNNNTFAPDKNLTRINFVPIQSRMLGYKYFADKIREKEKAETLQKFVDRAQIPDWARGFITVAVKGNLISGYPDGTFKPNKEISRAEIASLFYQMLKTPKEGDKDESYEFDLIPVTGSPFRITLSKYLSKSLFQYSGKGYSGGKVQHILNNIPFKQVNVNPDGTYVVNLPIGFIGIGEVNFEAKYYEYAKDKPSKTLKAYSAVPTDLFPNHFRSYHLSFDLFSNELVFSSKSASPGKFTMVNKTTGEKKEVTIEIGQDYSVSAILVNGPNNIDLIIQTIAEDKLPKDDPNVTYWKLTYGIIFTVN